MILAEAPTIPPNCSHSHIITSRGNLGSTALVLLQAQGLYRRRQPTTQATFYKPSLLLSNTLGPKKRSTINWDVILPFSSRSPGITGDG